MKFISISLTLMWYLSCIILLIPVLALGALEGMIGGVMGLFRDGKVPLVDN